MCCAEHPIQAAKQTLRQPNEKAHPVSGEESETEQRTKYSTNRPSLAPSHE